MIRNYRLGFVTLLMLVCVLPSFGEEGIKRDAHDYIVRWHVGKSNYHTIAKAPVDKVEIVNGTHFFPPEYVFLNKHPIKFSESSRKHVHDEIGEGTFYNVIERLGKNANILKYFGDHVALTYKSPSEEFQHIKGFFSFVQEAGTKVVEVEHYDGHVHHDGLRMYRDHSYHRSDHSHYSSEL